MQQQTRTCTRKQAMFHFLVAMCHSDDMEGCHSLGLCISDDANNVKTRKTAKL